MLGVILETKDFAILVVLTVLGSALAAVCRLTAKSQLAELVNELLGRQE